MAKLPYYFYDINAVLPDGKIRWYDEFSSESIIIDPKLETPRMRTRKYYRDRAYAAWLAGFSFQRPDGIKVRFLKDKTPKWQVIQVLKFEHSEYSKKDWWENYQDALFRVYVSPETMYSGKGNKQWYVLSPEDCYLVNRYELEKNGPSLPPRDAFKEPFISLNKKLRKVRFIPVECCRHWRHETTAGELPAGL